MLYYLEFMSAGDCEVTGILSTVVTRQESNCRPQEEERKPCRPGRHHSDYYNGFCVYDARPCGYERMWALCGWPAGVVFTFLGYVEACGGWHYFRTLLFLTDKNAHVYAN